ncbi:hypothetical protein [Xenorhabdus kozodoii]|uniref:T3SS effector protein EspK n=1 Tax=Xenorhabdus kozodoii TaxID=351676 RepID=A0A2D0LEU4_9GAMM|nr:hypothetical protein [Xenorhabdus kozodoii]PHM74219.1 T3SS effector protein EspK [Xenorhabdus kozodoii]
MPFYPKFRTTFEPGDLIFGLSEERSKYAQKHPSFVHCHDPNNIFVIDKYSITQREITVRNLLGHQIPHNQESFTRAIEKHHKYKGIRNKESDNDIKIDFSVGKVHYSKSVTRQKCKAGLSWYSHSLNNSCIHFILDGIDMKRVLNKTNEIKKINKSYTGSELRWIYRNRNDPRVKSCIQFWRNGRPVLPPWIEGREAYLWQDYHPKSENSDIEIGEFAETVLNQHLR